MKGHSAVSMFLTNSPNPELEYSINTPQKNNKTRNSGSCRQIAKDAIWGASLQLCIGGLSLGANTKRPVLAALILEVRLLCMYGIAIRVVGDFCNRISENDYFCSKPSLRFPARKSQVLNGLTTEVTEARREREK